MNTMSLVVLYLLTFGTGVVLARSALSFAAAKAEAHRQRYVEGVAHQLDEMRCSASPKAIYRITVACTLGFPLAVALVSRSPLAGVLAVPAGYVLPGLVLRWVDRRRRLRFDEQLVEAMDLMANCLQGGRNLPDALAEVATEMKGPIAEEFRITLSEVRLGRTLGDALRAMGERMTSDDLNLVITAILIASETGGNIGRTMRTIAVTVRERNAVQRKIRSATAQGKMQAMMIGALPFALMFALRIVDPESMQRMFDDLLGRLLLVLAVVLMGIGALVIRRIVTVDV
jgi:tight adherence protein B